MNRWRIGAMTVRMALSTTWRDDKRAVVRAVVVTLASTAVAVIAGILISTANLAKRVDARATNTSVSIVGDHEPADFSHDTIFDSIGGEQIYVHYWRVERPGATVPGIPEGARLGQWFVSPELQRRIATEPGLRGRFLDARVIGTDGITSASQLVAHRLVGPDTDLRFRVAAGQTASRVRGAVGFEARDVAAASIVLVMLMGSGLLLAALGPSACGLQRRLSILRSLGASGLSLRMVAAATGAAMAAPGAFLGSLTWSVAAPQLQRVPLVGQRVLRGDLALSSVQVVGIAMAITTLAGLLAARRSRSRVRLRPTLRLVGSPSHWRIAPLIVSVTGIAYATTQSGELSVRLFVTSLFAAAISVVIALPLLLHSLGKRLARVGSLPLLLAGHRLRWDAGRASLPLVTLAAVGVLVPVAVSYVANARGEDPDPPGASVETVTLNGEVDAGTLQNLESVTGGVFVDIYYHLDDNADTPPITTWVADCDALRTVVEVTSCDADGIILESAASAAVAHFDAGSSVAPTQHELEQRVLISKQGSHAEQGLRAFVLNNNLTNLGVWSYDDAHGSESATVAWIVAAVQVGAATAIVALLLSVANNASRSASTRVRLLAIGARRSLIRRVASIESAALVAVVGLAATAIGTLGAFAYSLVDGSALPNYAPSLGIALCVLVAATLAAAAAAASVNASVLTTSSNQLDGLS